MSHERYRDPVVAGQFYPADRNDLKKTVEEYLEGEPSLADPGPVGLICPHAGYVYSGPTAGRAYSEIRDRAPELAIVLGTSHQDRFRGATMWPGPGYRTPLGELPAPSDLEEALNQEPASVTRDRLGHRDEHSIEVQLPFLQVVAPEASVLPLAMGDDRTETCLGLGEAISRAVGNRRALIVASSDFYHGHSHDACRETDGQTLAALERNDHDELAAGFRKGTFQACGRGPILTLLEACRQLGAEKVRVLEQTNSDEVMGQSGGYVVGYAAVAISRE